jgi:hypothetical protein
VAQALAGAALGASRLLCDTCAVRARLVERRTAPTLDNEPATLATIRIGS